MAQCPGAADQPAGNGIDAERRQGHGQQEDTGADHRSDDDRTCHPDAELLVPLGELGRTCRPAMPVAILRPLALAIPPRRPSRPGVHSRG